jgi:hypothetical protein
LLLAGAVVALEGQRLLERPIEGHVTVVAHTRQQRRRRSALVYRFSDSTAIV